MPTALLYTSDFPSAQAELEAKGGRILQRFSNRLFTADLPRPGNSVGLKFASADPPRDLDQQSQLLANAWNVPATAEPKQAMRPWDATGTSAPRNGSSDQVLGAEQSDGGALTTEHPAACRTMIGNIAVGVAIVVGKKGAYAIDVAERQRLYAQVQRGLHNLSVAEPKAKVSFSWDTPYVETTVAPGHARNDTDYEGCEKPWRDSALITMGYAAGRDGQSEYVAALKATFNTKWAVVMYITTYPLTHFAYAGGDRMVLHTGNDGRGRDKLHYVVAHEACHLFGALDEYGQCTCGKLSPCLKIANNNCKNCPGDQIDCLMAGDNSYAMCKWTRSQLGWDAITRQTSPGDAAEP